MRTQVVQRGLQVSAIYVIGTIVQDYTIPSTPPTTNFLYLSKTPFNDKLQYLSNVRGRMRRPYRGRWKQLLHIHFYVFRVISFLNFRHCIFLPFNFTLTCVVGVINVVFKKLIAHTIYYTYAVSRMSVLMYSRTFTDVQYLITD